MSVQRRLDARLGALGLIVGVDAVLGPFADAVYLVPVAVLFVVLGIPHGAFDVWIFERTAAGKTGPFIVGYLLLVAVMLGLWSTWAPLAFGLFIALSVHHFGEGDLADGSPRWMQLLRGLFMVGLPLLSHADEVAPVVRAMGVHFDSATSVARVAILVILLVQIPTLLHPFWSGRRRQAEELVYLSCWAIAFYQLPALLSFTLYFCLWHAVEHLGTVRRRFASTPAGDRPLSWRVQLLRWMPYAVAPNLALLYAAWGPQDPASVERLAAFALILTASLTLPHAVLVTWALKPTAS